LLEAESILAVQKQVSRHSSTGQSQHSQALLLLQADDEDLEENAIRE